MERRYRGFGVRLESNFVPSASPICISRHFCSFEREINKQPLDFISRIQPFVCIEQRVDIEQNEVTPPIAIYL